MKRDNRRFPNLSVQVLSIFTNSRLHTVTRADVTQLVCKGQAPGVLFTCAKYKEVKVKRQLHFQNSNLNTVSFRLMTEG